MVVGGVDLAWANGWQSAMVFWLSSIGPKGDDLEVGVCLAVEVDLGEVALLLDLDFFVGEVEAVGVVGLFAARAGVEIRLEELPFPLPAFLSPRYPPLPPMVVRPRWLGL